MQRLLGLTASLRRMKALTSGLGRSNSHEKTILLSQDPFLRMGNRQVGAPRHRRPCVRLDYHCHDTPGASDAALGDAAYPARRSNMRPHPLLLQGADWQHRLLLDGYHCGYARLSAGRSRSAVRDFDRDLTERLGVQSLFLYHLKKLLVISKNVVSLHCETGTTTCTYHFPGTRKV